MSSPDTTHVNIHRSQVYNQNSARSTRTLRQTDRGNRLTGARAVARSHLTLLSLRPWFDPLSFPFRIKQNPFALELFLFWFWAGNEFPAKAKSCLEEEEEEEERERGEAFWNSFRVYVNKKIERNERDQSLVKYRWLKVYVHRARHRDRGKRILTRRRERFRRERVIYYNEKE